MAVAHVVAVLQLYDLYVYAKERAAERRTPGLSAQPIRGVISFYYVLVTTLSEGLEWPNLLVDHSYHFLYGPFLPTVAGFFSLSLLGIYITVYHRRENGGKRVPITFSSSSSS